jgi:hypothetical protein
MDLDLFDDEADEAPVSAYESPMASLMKSQNRLLFAGLPRAFKMPKYDSLSNRALQNVTQENPEIAQHGEMFKQVFEKATTNISEKTIHQHQSSLARMMSAKGKVETNLQIAKIASDEDLRQIHAFCTRLVASGCQADLTQTGNSSFIFLKRFIDKVMCSLRSVSRQPQVHRN